MNVEMKTIELISVLVVRKKPSLVARLRILVNNYLYCLGQRLKVLSTWVTTQIAQTPENPNFWGIIWVRFLPSDNNIQA
jgi:hypothetical protein